MVIEVVPAFAVTVAPAGMPVPEIAIPITTGPAAAAPKVLGATPVQVTVVVPAVLLVTMFNGFAQVFKTRFPVVLMTIDFPNVRLLERVAVAAFEMLIEKPLFTAETVVAAGIPVPLTVMPTSTERNRVGSMLVTSVLPPVVVDSTTRDPTPAGV
jgi:hypothetical protein